MKFVTPRNGLLGSAALGMAAILLSGCHAQSGGGSTAPPAEVQKVRQGMDSAYKKPDGSAANPAPANAGGGGQ